MKRQKWKDRNPSEYQKIILLIQSGHRVSDVAKTVHISRSHLTKQLVEDGHITIRKNYRAPRYSLRD